MPRRALPIAKRLRTFPVRLPNALYTMLKAVLEITGVSIQEQIRRAIETELDKRREEMAKLGVEFPHELHFSSMTDDEFTKWAAGVGKRLKASVATAEADAAEAEEDAAPRRKFRTKTTQPVA